MIIKCWINSAPDAKKTRIKIAWKHSNSCKNTSAYHYGGGGGEGMIFVVKISILVAVLFWMPSWCIGYRLIYTDTAFCKQAFTLTISAIYLNLIESIQTLLPNRSNCCGQLINIRPTVLTDYPNPILIVMAIKTNSWHQRNHFRKANSRKSLYLMSDVNR